MAKIYRQPSFRKGMRPRGVRGLPVVFGNRSRREMGLLNQKGTSMPFNDAGFQVLGMFIAVMSGSSLNWVMSKLNLLKENTSIRNLLVSAMGTGLSWKLPYLLDMIGLKDFANKLESSPTMRSMLQGMTTMFGFSTAMAGFGVLGEKANISLPFIANETSLLSTISESADTMRTASGIFTDKDYTSKIEDLKASLSMLEAEYQKLPEPTTVELQQIYAQVKNQIGYAGLNLQTAQEYLNLGKSIAAENDLLNAQENIITVKAFLAGLTAMTSALPETTLPSETPAVENVVQITNTETGETVEVPAPETVETPIEVAEGQLGGAFDVNMIENWAGFVAPQINWTPSQVLTGFILRYLANNGHLWAFGKRPVDAYMSVSGADEPAYLTHNGRVYEVDSIDGVRELITTIKGY